MLRDARSGLFVDCSRAMDQQASRSDCGNKSLPGDIGTSSTTRAVIACTAYLERYAQGGSILDLGCGPGNTANELAAESYRTYLGVDISEAALEKGRRRSGKNGRGSKKSFVQGDFIGYQPAGQFDVILFRESMYHVPVPRIKPVLEHYSSVPASRWRVHRADEHEGRHVGAAKGDGRLDRVRV